MQQLSIYTACKHGAEKLKVDSIHSDTAGVLMSISKGFSWEKKNLTSSTTGISIYASSQLGQKTTTQPVY